MSYVSDRFFLFFFFYCSDFYEKRTKHEIVRVGKITDHLDFTLNILTFRLDFGRKGKLSIKNYDLLESSTINSVEIQNREWYLVDIEAIEIKERKICILSTPLVNKLNINFEVVIRNYFKL